VGSTEPVGAGGRLADLAVMLGLTAFVLLAIALEVSAGGAANSPEPGWVERVAPLGWPQPARVAWWTIVGVAAWRARTRLDRFYGREPSRYALLFAAPYAIFAVGIAFGASWSTWH